MGDAVERLALAGTQRVSGYTRTSKLGNTVRVGAYFRSPGSMSSDEVVEELNALDGDESAKARHRKVLLNSELRRRRPSLFTTLRAEAVNPRRDEARSEGIRPEVLDAVTDSGIADQMDFDQPRRNMDLIEDVADENGFPVQDVVDAVAFIEAYDSPPDKYDLMRDEMRKEYAEAFDLGFDHAEDGHSQLNYDDRSEAFQRGYREGYSMFSTKAKKLVDDRKAPPIAEPRNLPTKAQDTEAFKKARAELQKRTEAFRSRNRRIVGPAFALSRDDESSTDVGSS